MNRDYDTSKILAWVLGYTYVWREESKWSPVYLRLQWSSMQEDLEVRVETGCVGAPRRMPFTGI